MDIQKNFKLVDVDAIQKAKLSGYFNVLVDHWWIVTPDNKVMIYRGNSPQCNMSKLIAQKIKDKLYPECSVRKIDIAYIPIRARDF